jgi:hypothetical protein
MIQLGIIMSLFQTILENGIIGLMELEYPVPVEALHLVVAHQINIQYQLVRQGKLHIFLLGLMVAYYVAALV